MATRNKSKVASYIYILFAVVFIGGHIVDIQPLLCNFLIALYTITDMQYIVKVYRDYIDQEKCK